MALAQLAPMMIRLLLLTGLLGWLYIDAGARPCAHRYVKRLRMTAGQPEGIVSGPVSASSGSRLWVRLVGQAEEDGRIVLHWQTGPAPPARSFRVERSTDGVTWEALGDIGGGAEETQKKKAYQFIDEAPLRTGVYRLQCLTEAGISLCSSVLMVVNPRRVNQPVRYFTIYEQAILVGIESANLIFPVTANLYSEAGSLLCYDQLPKNTNEFRIALPLLKDASVKLQIVDGAHRVLAVRKLTLRQ